MQIKRDTEQRGKTGVPNWQQKEMAEILNITPQAVGKTLMDIVVRGKKPTTKKRIMIYNMLPLYTAYLKKEALLREELNKKVSEISNSDIYLSKPKNKKV